MDLSWLSANNNVAKLDPETRRFVQFSAKIAGLTGAAALSLANGRGRIRRSRAGARTHWPADREDPAEIAKS